MKISELYEFLKTIPEGEREHQVLIGYEGTFSGINVVDTLAAGDVLLWHNPDSHRGRAAGRWAPPDTSSIDYTLRSARLVPAHKESA